MYMNNNDLHNTIAFAKTAASLNNGRWVTLTTRRGVTVEGILTARHASCTVGLYSYAYGGIADIRLTAPRDF
jgi:hypothetical protein